MERVVKRSDLVSDEDSPPSSPDVNALRQIRTEEFEYLRPDDAVKTALQGETHVESEDELDFRLFASSAPSNAQDPVPSAAKIRLKSPELSNVEPGFVHPHRKPSHYFTEKPSDLEQGMFRAAALTGADVIERSRSFVPGSAYAWRVLHINATEKQRREMLSKGTAALEPKLRGDDERTKRKRPGKKARIKLRIRLAAEKAKTAKALQDAEEKEAADKEKRTRRNREKKVKKKFRDKAKKVEAKEEIGEDSPD